MFETVNNRLFFACQEVAVAGQQWYGTRDFSISFLFLDTTNRTGQFPSTANAVTADAATRPATC